MPKDPKKLSYEVGYGKPPKATQFKPGQSGNRRGRPKKAVSFQRKVERFFQDELHLKLNGQRKRVQLEDACLLGFKKGLLEGPITTRIAIFKFLQGFRPTFEEEPEWDLSQLSDEELDGLETLLIKAAAAG